MSAAQEKSYRVNGELVILKVAGQYGIEARTFYRGAVVTGLLDDEQVQHHLKAQTPEGLTLIEEVVDDAAPEPELVPDPDPEVQADAGDSKPDAVDSKPASRSRTSKATGAGL
jgi:hypothetical protein